MRRRLLSGRIGLGLLRFNGRLFHGRRRRRVLPRLLLRAREQVWQPVLRSRRILRRWRRMPPGQPDLRQRAPLREPMLRRSRWSRHWNLLQRYPAMPQRAVRRGFSRRLQWRWRLSRGLHLRRCRHRRHGARPPGRPAGFLLPAGIHHGWQQRTALLRSRHLSDRPAKFSLLPMGQPQLPKLHLQHNQRQTLGTTAPSLPIRYHG
jgi:hypothetical protein